MEKQCEKINYIFLWRQNDWGLFKRRNEALLLELSRRDSVESVLHVEPLTPKSFLGLIARWWQAKDDSVREVYKLHFKKALSLSPIKADSNKKIYVYSVFLFSPLNAGIIKNIIASSLSPFRELAIFGKIYTPSSGVDKQNKIYNYKLALFNVFNTSLEKINNLLIRFQGNIINRKFIQTKKNIVLVVYPPSYYQPALIDTIKHDILVADLVDDVIVRTNSMISKNKYIDICRTILPKCKWIFSTSPALAEYRNYAEQDIECLPNGVDSDGFSRSSSKNYFENHTRKTAGYVGNINQLVDLDLLEYVIASYPQVDFILIGRIDTKERFKCVKRIMDQHNNCHYLGERKFTEIPAYLSSMDVLISFKKADVSTRGNDSMKIYQYLLSGKPIVSLPLSPADRFAGLIYLASDKFQFVEYLKKALEENDPEMRNKRINTALENTWTKRADVVHNRVLKYFGISTSNTCN